MKKILALMGAVLLLSVSARAVEVSAPSALLMEKETGTVLFAKNEHEKLEPASVTKIMTLLLTMEAIDGGTLRYEDTVTASPHACSMGGSQIWLKEGERLTVDEMLFDGETLSCPVWYTEFQGEIALAFRNLDG